jgi:hypothetical protein
MTLEEIRRDWIAIVSDVYARKGEGVWRLEGVEEKPLFEKMLMVRADPGTRELHIVPIFAKRHDNTLFDSAWYDRFRRFWVTDKGEIPDAFYPMVFDVRKKADQLLLPGLNLLWKEWELLCYTDAIGYLRLRVAAKELLPDPPQEQPEWDHIKEILVDRTKTGKYTLIPNFSDELGKFFGVNLKDPSKYAKEPKDWSDSDDPRMFSRYMQQEDGEKALRAAFAADPEHPWVQWRALADPVVRDSVVKFYETTVIKKTSNFYLKPKDATQAAGPNQAVFTRELATELRQVDNRLGWRLHETSQPIQDPPLSLVQTRLDLQREMEMDLTPRAMDLDAAFLQHVTADQTLLQVFFERIAELQPEFLEEVATRAQRIERGPLAGQARQDQGEVTMLRLAIETAMYRKLLSTMARELYTRLENFVNDERVQYMTRESLEQAVRSSHVLKPLYEHLGDRVTSKMVLSKGVWKGLAYCYPTLKVLLEDLILPVYKVKLAKRGAKDDPDPEFTATEIKATYLDTILDTKRRTKQQLDARPAEDLLHYNEGARKVRLAIRRLVYWFVRFQAHHREEAGQLIAAVEFFWTQHKRLSTDEATFKENKEEGDLNIAIEAALQQRFG